MRPTVSLAAALLSSIVATAPVRAQTLPSDGTGCEGAIGRWQEFSAKENQGGHMDSSVYDRIQTEIAQASELCRAGQSAQATKMIQASMKRHGY